MLLTRNRAIRQSVVSHTAQRGAALIVGLIMLLLVTLLGVAGMRDTLLQEKMAGNMRDREIAVQAAEAALSTGLKKLMIDETLPVFTNANGLYEQEQLKREKSGTPVTEQSFWRDWTWTDNDSVVYAGAALDGITKNPRYVIEQMSVEMSRYPNPNQSAANGGTVQEAGLVSEDLKLLQDYRVTAIGWGITGETASILQATYRRETQK